LPNLRTLTFIDPANCRRSTKFGRHSSRGHEYVAEACGFSHATIFGRRLSSTRVRQVRSGSSVGQSSKAGLYRMSQREWEPLLKSSKGGHRQIRFARCAICRYFKRYRKGQPFRSNIISSATLRNGNLSIRAVPPKIIPQRTVSTLAVAVWGLAMKTGSQTNEIASEANRRIRTHLLGRDVGFKRRQMPPRSRMLIDTETETTARSIRNTSTARVAESTRELWHSLP
jgi:ribosomal protein L16/L10AE